MKRNSDLNYKNDTGNKLIELETHSVPVYERYKFVTPTHEPSPNVPYIIE